MVGFRVVVTAVALCACRDLPELSHDVCGNGVLEAGEDCDLAGDPARGTDLACAPPDDANACRYTCAAPAACPHGWACGDDAICRFGAGTLVLGASLALAHDDVTIGDIDGDRMGDPIAFSDRGVRIATASGGVIKASPDQLTGPGGAADLDGDGRTDVVAPVSLGLEIARGETDGSVTPVSYAPYAAPASSWFLPVRVPADASGDSVAALVPASVGVGSVVHLYRVPSGELEHIVPIEDAPTPQGFAADSVRADLDASVAGDELVIVAPGSPIAWLLRPVVTIFGKVAMTPTPIAMPDQPSYSVSDGRVRAADVTGDGALDLVFGILDATGSGVAIAANASGTFGPAVRSLAFADLAAAAPVSSVAAAHQEMPLAIGDLDGDSMLDAVAADAIVLGRDGAFVPVYRRATAEAWREAVITDVDRDGRPDVVVTSHAAGIDVLRNLAGGFTRVAIDAAGPTAMLRTGDLDADGLGDVLFRERTSGRDRVRVLFGAVGAFAPPQAVTGAPGIVRFEVGRFADAFGVVDTPDDLVLVSADSQRGGVSMVGGAGDRRLSSPLFLARASRSDRPQAVITGRFRDAGPHTGLAALASDDAGRRQLWVFPGAVEAAFRSESAYTTSQLGALADLDVRRLAAADLDGDGLDELVAIGRDGSHRGQLIALDVTGNAAPRVTTIELDVGEPLDLAAADSDLDGRAEVVVTGTAGVVLWRAGAISTVPGSGMRSACFAQLDDDPQLELALVGDTLELREPDGITVRSVYALPARASLVRAGDLDGDGIADLAVGDGATLTPFYSVPQVPL